MRRVSRPANPWHSHGRSMPTASPFVCAMYYMKVVHGCFGGGVLAIVPRAERETKVWLDRCHKEFGLGRTITMRDVLRAPAPQL